MEGPIPNRGPHPAIIQEQAYDMGSDLDRHDNRRGTRPRQASTAVLRERIRPSLAFASLGPHPADWLPQSIESPPHGAFRGPAVRLAGFQARKLWREDK